MDLQQEDWDVLIMLQVQMGTERRPIGYWPSSQYSLMIPTMRKFKVLQQQSRLVGGKPSFTWCRKEEITHMEWSMWTFL